MSVNMTKITYTDLDAALQKKKRLGDEPLCDATYMDRANKNEQEDEMERRELYFDSILQKLMHPRRYDKKVKAKNISKLNKDETKKKLRILKNKSKKQNLMQYINETISSAFRFK